MEKQSKTKFGKKVYLLGVLDNEKIWLEEPKFDCEWYWGLGYVETYTPRGDDISSHRHFDTLFTLDSFMDLESPFSQNEKYQIYELMKQLYTLRHYADMMHLGGAHITSRVNALKSFEDSNKAEYNRINQILIPKVWDELKAILC